MGKGRNVVPDKAGLVPIITIHCSTAFLIRRPDENITVTCKAATVLSIASATRESRGLVSQQQQQQQQQQQ